MAIEAVAIDFAARGVMETLRAFDRIEERIVRMERATGAQAKTTSRERVETTKREVNERERAYNKLQADEEKADRKRRASFAKEVKRAADEEIREGKRVAREVEKLEQWKLRVRQRSSEMAGQYAAKQAAAELRQHEQMVQRLSRGATRALGKGVGAVGNIAGMGVTAMGIGGGFVLGDAVRRQLSAENAAAQLLNSATIGGKAPAGASVASIQGQASQASRQYGVDKTELIGAVQNYVAKSSDYAGGMENMGFFAKLSKATGTKLEDITSAAGILRAQNKNLSAGDAQQMLLDLTEQGKQGAVEITDLASLAGGLASTRGLYEGSSTENQRKLLALAQITRTEGTSAEEAMIGVKDLGTEAVKKAGKAKAPQWLKDAVDHKSGKIKGGPEALIDAALMGTGGNLGKLIDVFDAKGARAFERLAPIFQAAGGGKAGLAAVHAETDPILNARGSQANLDKQYDTVMSQPAERFAKALNEVITVAEDKLEPWLEKFADKLPELIPKFEAIIDEAGKLAEWFAENPFKGIGAIVALAVGKEMAAAGISVAVEKALSTQLGGGIAVAAATLAIGVATIDIMAEAEKNRQRAVVATTNEAVNEAGRIYAGARAGTLTPAEIKKAQDDAAAMSAQISERDRRNGVGTRYAKQLTDQEKGEQKNVELALTALTDALKFAASNIRSTTANIPTGQAGAAPGPPAPDNPARNEPMPARGDPRHV
jgi:hypothetical protein